MVIHDGTYTTSKYLGTLAIVACRSGMVTHTTVPVVLMQWHVGVESPRSMICNGNSGNAERQWESHTCSRYSSIVSYHIKLIKAPHACVIGLDWPEYLRKTTTMSPSLAIYTNYLQPPTRLMPEERKPDVSGTSPAGRHGRSAQHCPM